MLWTGGSRKRADASSISSAAVDLRREEHLNDYMQWLGAPAGTPPPTFLLDVLGQFHPAPPDGRGTVLAIDGGGVRLSAYVPGIVVGLEQQPHLFVASSASTYFAAELMRATSVSDIAESMKGVNNVPYKDLFRADEHKYGMPQASASLIEEWDRRRTNDATVNDYRFDGDVPPGLEGYRHRLQVTICVGVMDRTDVERLGVGELSPGEQKEFCFWDAVIAKYRGKSGGRARMRQYVFPRDLFSHDPARPNALGPLGTRLAPLIANDQKCAVQHVDGNVVMRWLDTQFQATWNAHSSRNPFGIKAMAVGMPDGKALVITDGQMLGPPPLVHENQQTMAMVQAARTMPVDLRKRRNKLRQNIRQINLNSERAAALDFAAFTPEVAYEMSRRGLSDAMSRQLELRQNFSWDREQPVDAVDSTAYPLTFRPSEHFWQIIYYNSPLFLGLGSAVKDKVPSPRDAWEGSRSVVSMLLRREGRESEAQALAQLDGDIGVTPGIA